jgi:hypothetical protein
MTQPTTTDDAAAGPILSYDVPQAVSYSGQGFIEIVLDAGAFLAQRQSAPPVQPRATQDGGTSGATS